MHEDRAPKDSGSAGAPGGTQEGGNASYGRWRPLLWNGGIAVLLVGILVRLNSTTVADPDLWGHIRFGRLTRRLGHLTLVDPFSYVTVGHDWINHEWLSEVIYSRVWDTFHTAGLVAFKLAIILLILLLVYRRLRRYGLGLLRSALVLVTVSIPTVLGVVTVRPQLFTYLGFVITLLILEGAEEDGHGTWRLWLLPPLFAGWINLHGGVLAGLGVLGVWAGAHVALAARHRWLLHVRSRSAEGAVQLARPAGPGALLAVAVAVAAMAALVLNPYGLRLPLFLFRTATVPRPDISEWQPLAIVSSLGLVYLAYVAGVAWTLLRSPRRPRPAILAVLAVTAILPLTAVRHLPLFGLAVGVLLARDFGAVFGPRRQVVPRGRAAAWLGAASGLIGIAFAFSSLPAFGCIRLGPGKGGIDYPARAVGLLRQSGARGNLAVFFTWGEYGIWKLYPTFRVGMDGRRETVYPDSVYDEYLDWMRGVGDWSRFLELGPADVALVPRDRPVYNLMSQSPEWPRVYQDTLAAVFARRGSRDAALLRAASPPDRPPDGKGLCFP